MDRHIQDLHKQPDSHTLYQNHQKRCHQHSGKDLRHQSGRIRKQRRTRPQAVNDQSAHQSRCHAVPRNSQSHHGDQGPAAHSVIRRLWGHHPLISAIPKLFRILWKTLGLVIGNKRGDIPSGCRNNPDSRSNHAGTDDIPLLFPQLPDRRKKILQL